LALFLDDYFTTLPEPVDVRAAYMNFISDIDAYRGDPAGKVYVKYHERLRKAFLEMTGQGRYRWEPYVENKKPKAIII
jgi:hypothetical protein